MNVQVWLEQLAKLDELINAKLAERDQIMSLSARLTSESDGMPHAPGVSDPVGNSVVKLVMISREIDQLIDQYVDRKKQVIDTLKKLPAKQFGVLYRYYVRHMTLENIAIEMGYCERQIQRIKKKGLQNLESVLECHVKM